MSRRFFLKNLLMFLLPLLIPVIILGTLSIVVTKQYIQSEINKNNLIIFNQIDRNMELVFNEMDSLYVSLGNPDAAYRLEQILNTQTLTLENLRLMKTILNFIDGPANAKPYIESIYVYVNNEYDQLLTSREGLTRLTALKDTAWKNSMKQHEQESGIWTEQREIQRYTFEEPLRVTTLYKNLYSTVSNRPVGVVVLNLYTNYIEKQLDQLTLSGGQRLYVLNRNRKIIFENSPAADMNIPDISKLPYSSVSLNWKNKSESYLVSQSRSAHDWTYVSITPRKSLNRVPFTLSTFTLLFVALSFVTGLVLTYILTQRNVKHIRYIINLIQHAERGTALPEITSFAQNDEYAYISQSIIKNFIEQYDLKIQLTEKKYKLRTAELLALQAQINPHFLFNTLETVYWKVARLTGSPNEANRMIEHLSALLKYSLTLPGERVLVQEEINYTQNYISIQEIRYPDRFRVTWQSDPEDIHAVTMAKLLLQPLIENCIAHGLREEAQLLQIKVKISSHPRHLHIAVIDNGCGMDHARLNEVRRQISSDQESHSHIGLSNTCKRIELLYGTTNHLTIQSKLGWGTVVRLSLPLQLT